jgi:hypothetical protein
LLEVKYEKKLSQVEEEEQERVPRKMEMVPQEAQGAKALEKVEEIGRNRTILNRLSSRTFRYFNQRN